MDETRFVKTSRTGQSTSVGRMFFVGAHSARFPLGWDSVGPPLTVPTLRLSPKGLSFRYERGETVRRRSLL